MSVTNAEQLNRAQRAREARLRASAGSHSAELTARSLSQLVNQLKEEIAR
jgi:hypothetical protein